MMCRFCQKDVHPKDDKVHMGPTFKKVEVTNVYAQEDVVFKMENLTLQVKRALCAERVSQMTKTYHDIDAVTRLLEEKEKDLELAAKIGQTLLQRNKNLEQKNEQLEEHLTLATEKNAQLSHEIQMKTDLLQIYTNEVDYSESEDESISSLGDRSGSFRGSPFNVGTLQKKINYLEEENLQLRLESTQLKTDTSNYEEKETQLVHDCVKQLGEVNTTVEILKDELIKKLEDNQRQQEEITSLLAQIVDLQQKVKKLTFENDELHQELTAGKEAQHELTAELSELKEKYDECMAMVREYQETAKSAKRPSMGATMPYTPLSAFPQDSLASEIESTVKHSLMQAEGYSPKENTERNKNIMKTVKVAHKTRAGLLSIPGSSMPSTYTSRRTSPCSSIAPSDRNTPLSDHYHGDGESSEAGSSTRFLGRPGIPGSNDLELALRRLSLRRQNREFERKYVETNHDNSGNTTPLGRSPESIMSTGSFSDISGFSSTSLHSLGIRSYLPEKLQIVKPMEGSMTLHHWQRLATPDMASMLDTRPGVYVKGYRTLEHEEEIFSLDDVEDDGNVTRRRRRRLRRTQCQPFSAPSKYENTNTTLTFTNSKILHLDDNTQVTSSAGPKPSVLKLLPPKLDSPVKEKEKATTTFSTTLPLARLLKERGISSITPPQTSESESEKTDKEKTLIHTPRVAPLLPPPTTTPGTSGIIQRNVIMSAPRISTGAPIMMTTSSIGPPKFSLVDKIKGMGMSHTMMTHSTMSTQVTSSVSTNPLLKRDDSTTTSSSTHAISGPMAVLSGNLAALRSIRKGGPIL
ncbi:trafficking kinesin-binding protein 1-like isoform X2 [Glandiceps talaboti]